MINYVYRTVRPSEQVLHTHVLDPDRLYHAVPGLFHPDAPGPRFAVTSLDDIGSYGRKFKINLVQGVDAANVLADVAQHDGPIMIFYPASDRDAQVASLPASVRHAVDTLRGMINSEPMLRHDRLDVQYVYRLPENVVLPDGYTLRDNAIIPASMPALYVNTAYNPLGDPLALDMAITNLPWEYAGMVFRASSRCLINNADFNTMTLLLDKYAGLLHQYWAALDGTCHSSDHPSHSLNIYLRMLDSVRFEMDDSDAEILSQLCLKYLY